MRELCLQRNVSTSSMTRNRIILYSEVFRVFWRPLFSTFHAALFIISRKYLFGCPKSTSTPQHLVNRQFWTRGFPLTMRSRNVGLPFATRARKRKLLIWQVRIENDSDRIFSKVFLKSVYTQNIICSVVNSLA